MKTANVYDIERALQQPITPEQRQTAAANNPLAAVIAQRLDGIEGNLRQKLQTPPPPQGTVMNQYFQWPQQEMQYGLAQPGLEELAQQYASGGLVAFANGGLASMLPMGYAGEEDMPVFNGYAEGGGMKVHEYPWRVRGESEEPRYINFDEEDEDKFWEDVPTATEGEKPLKEYAASDTAGMSNGQPWPFNPSAIQHPGFDKGRSLLSELGDKANAIDKVISEGIKSTGKTALDRMAGAGERWSERLAPVKEALAPLTDRFKAGQAERERIEGLPAAYAAAMKAGEPMPEVKYEPTISGEDIKREKQQEAKSKKAAAAVAKAEAPARAKKAAYSPAVSQPTPAAPAGPGVSLLSPAAWDAERGAGLTPTGSTMPTVVTDGQIDEVPQTPERQAVSHIVNSNLTADQQIAALEKYFQTDTSEAMRIKGEMEKENARAGNLGILTALAGAVGAGLGTYGPGARRMGAGLMQFASGVMGEQQQAEARQAKLNDLALKVKEMQGSGTRKAAEMVLSARAKADAEKSDLQKALLVEQVKGANRRQIAEIGAGATRYAADARSDAAAARARGADGDARLQVQKDRIAADLLAKASEAVKLNPASPAYETERRLALRNLLADAPDSIKQMFPTIDSVLAAVNVQRGPMLGTIRRDSNQLIAP